MDSLAPVPARQELLDHARFVRGLAGKLVRDPAEADDVAQEALLAGLRAPARPRLVRAWLAGTVRRILRMRHRTETRRRKRESAALRPTVSDPAQVLAQMEVQRSLVDAVLGLSEPYRSTIVHRYFHDLVPAAIAELVGVPVETVRTRLARAHAQLRERLDRDHASRAAWAVPLLGFADAPLAKGTAASATGVLLMTTSMKVVLVVSLAVTGALGVWVGTRIAAPARESPQAARSIERAAVHDVLARPTLEPGTRATPSNASTKPGEGRVATGESAETAPKTQPDAAKRAEAANPLDEVEWSRWIPVLVQYGALERLADFPDALGKDLEKFLSEVNPRLRGRRWGQAEDLFRMPDVASRFSLAAFEHFGAKLTPEKRAALLSDVEKALSEEMPGRKDALGIEKMAESLQAVARVYGLLAESGGEEVASSVAGLITGLLQDRGWGTLPLGPLNAAEFAGTMPQFFEIRATLESGERADLTKILREWWERAGNVLRDLSRAHGTNAVRAAVLAATDDDAASAAARAAKTFPGVRALVWAALIREQAVAERQFHDLWRKVPPDRRKSFEIAEPALALFWPRAS